MEVLSNSYLSLDVVSKCGCHMEDIPLWLMWCIWLEGNGRHFEDKECSFEEVGDFFFSSLSFRAKTLVIDGRDFDIWF